MAIAKRLLLFFAVNALVMVTIGIVLNALSALGIPVFARNYTGLMIWALVWGMGGSFIGLLLSKTMAKWQYGVKVIDPNTMDSRQLSLVNTVHRLADQAHLPGHPEVGIYDSDEVNAFATGASRGHALVAVSRGLLERLPPEQVEAVLGHEISHIANGDMVTMTLIQGVVNAFVIFFSRIVATLIGSQVEENKRGLVEFAVYMVAQILFGLLGMLVVDAFSRFREYRADSGSARLVGPGKMIAALQSLGRTQELIEPNQKAMATLKITDRRSWSYLWSTHPSLDDRIEALRQLQMSGSV